MRTTHGYSLVEVLVAMTILSIAMLFGLSFFVYGSRSGYTAEQNSRAMQLARNVLETQQASGYALIPPTIVQTFTLEGIAYTCAFTSTEVSDASDRYKKLTVTITWQQGGRQLSLPLSTIVAP